MKKYFIFAGLYLFLASDLFAFCIAGFGADCKKKDSKNEVTENRQNNSMIGILPYYRRDGGEYSRRMKGDKSKNQGYAEYKEHFLYYSYEALSIPHQKAIRSSNTRNKSIGYEYAFNPFISIKAQQTELYFDAFNADSSLKNVHTFALLNLRLYLLNSFVLRTGIGIGESNLKFINEDVEDDNYKGEISIVQMSLFYIWGDENTMLGVSSTVIEGRDGDENLGTSYYGLVASIGF